MKTIPVYITKEGICLFKNGKIGLKKEQGDFMTNRQLYKAHAISGLLSNPEVIYEMFEKIDHIDKNDYERLAKMAGSMADYMIEEEGDNEKII